MNNYFTAKQKRIAQVLLASLPNISEEPVTLYRAMHYAVLNGGKRLRPLLVYATGETLGAHLKQLDIPACAVELIHCYSLVHDDLPAMDNDDFRRGQPTCHKAFDEATAILVGDGLQTLAFQILTQAEILSSAQRLTMIQHLAEACGANGMVGGQALESTATRFDETLLKKIHALKTGALILASVQLGAIAADANTDDVKWLNDFGYYLGLAYQIQDDILDNATDKAELSFVAGIGLNNTKKYLYELREQALAALVNLSVDSKLLQALTKYMIKEL